MRGLSRITLSPPHGSQAMLDITRQSEYNPGSSGPFADRSATPPRPSKYVYIEQGDAYNTRFSTHLNNTTISRLQCIKDVVYHHHRYAAHSYRYDQTV
jgi:hypothetical protein